MDKPHPLKFFIDFVELKPLQSWEHNFFAEAIPEYDSPNNRKAGFIVALRDNSNGGQEEFDLYFKDVIVNKFIEQKSEAIQAIENELMSMADLNALRVKLAVLTASIVTLLDKVRIYKESKRFPVILEAYSQLKEELDSRAKLIVGWGKTAPKQGSELGSLTRLKWLGQLNVLATLFYDLRKGQGNGSPYISGSLEDIKKLLIAGFVDKDGNELSKSTLDTILMPSRREKRANIGDRIELPNKNNKN